MTSRGNQTLNEGQDEAPEEARLLGNEDGLGRLSSQARLTPRLSGLVLSFMAIHFLLAFCEIILVAPLIRLFENAICLSYFDFPEGGVDEPKCKMSHIQADVAEVRSGKSFFDTIPGVQSVPSVRKDLTYTQHC